MDLLLRASNEGLLRPRVARARKIIRLHPLLSSWGLCEQEGHLAAPSYLYFMRNAFEFSPEAVVTVRRTRPFLTPLGTVVVMLLLVC